MAVPSLGGAPRRFVKGFGVVPSPDGRFLYYLKTLAFSVFRADTWSYDGRWLYVDSVFESKRVLWKVAPDGSRPEKLVEDCLTLRHAAPDGKYLLGNCIASADRPPGICGYSLEEGSCVQVVAGVTTSRVKTTPDGRTILYAVSGRSEMIFYRAAWRDGKLAGQPEVAFKVPFAFPLDLGYFGSAFDFTPDLSTIVYARPAGQAELYFLGAKNGSTRSAGASWKRISAGG